MISRFLVAMDGSEEAWKGLNFAVELASQAGISISILTVVHEDSLLAASIREVPGPGNLTEPVEDYLRGIAESIAEDAVKYSREKGVQAQKVVRKGEPVEEILRVAQEVNAQSIVMGSRGRSSLEATLLGSVTSGIIQRATIPVVVVRR